MSKSIIAKNAFKFALKFLNSPPALIEANLPMGVLDRGGDGRVT